MSLEKLGGLVGKDCHATGRGDDLLDGMPKRNVRDNAQVCVVVSVAIKNSQRRYESRFHNSDAVHYEHIRRYTVNKAQALISPV